MRHAPSFQTFRPTASRPRSDDDGAVACLTLFWAVVLIMFQIFFHVLAPFFLLTPPKFSILGISLSFGAAIRAVSLFPPGGCWHWADLFLSKGRPMPTRKRGTAGGQRGTVIGGMPGRVDQWSFHGSRRRGISDSETWDRGIAIECGGVDGRNLGSGGREAFAAEEIQRVLWLFRAGGDGSVGSWRSVVVLLEFGPGAGQTGPGLARG